METHDQLERWVHQRIAGAEPAAEWPDPADGWRHLDQRIARRSPHRLWLWAGATTAVCAAVLALPGPRVVAQRLWDQVVLGRIQVMLVDYSGDGAAAAFFSPDIYQRADARPVPSIEAASARAGFSPRLPGDDVFAVSPSYSVADITAARWQLRTPAIRYLFDQAGGSASEVPDSWNGAVLEVRAGPMIIADYNGVLLLQSLPFQLTKPVDFDLTLFYRIGFQVLGMNEQEARARSADLSLSPALLTVMPKEEHDLVYGFRTKSGAGVMIHEVYGPGKIVALWSGADRVYALYPDTREVTREFVMTVANALE